eukprot:31499-Pelagococcus_subviridis.AAC.33
MSDGDLAVAVDAHTPAVASSREEPYELPHAIQHVKPEEEREAKHHEHAQLVYELPAYARLLVYRPGHLLEHADLPVQLLDFVVHVEVARGRHVELDLPAARRGSRREPFRAVRASIRHEERASASKKAWKVLTSPADARWARRVLPGRKRIRLLRSPPAAFSTTRPARFCSRARRGRILRGARPKAQRTARVTPRLDPNAHTKTFARPCSSKPRAIRPAASTRGDRIIDRIWILAAARAHCV